MGPRAAAANATPLSFLSMRPAEIADALRAAIDETTFDLNSFEDDMADPAAEFTWESVMDRLEIIDDPLDRLWPALLHLIKVMNSPELRAVEAEMREQVTAIQSRYTQSPVIFHAMGRLCASDECAMYSPEQKRILERRIQKCILHGVAVDEPDKDRFNEMQLRLKQLSMAYSNNMFDAIKEFSILVVDPGELKGVPASALALYAQNAVAAGYDEATAANGPWKLTLDRPAFTPFIKNCANRSLREQMYRAHCTIASAPPHDNAVVIQEILQLRTQCARLLGFPSYAELSLATKMAQSVAAVDDMIESLRIKSLSVSQAEVVKLEAYAAAHGQSEPLKPWDTSYWAEQVRKDEFTVDMEAIKKYFPLHQVLDGLFGLIERLYGVRIQPSNDHGQLWHPDVRCYDLRAMEQPGNPIVAILFVDLFMRPGQKQGGSWMEAFTGRSKVLGTESQPIRAPAIGLILNFPAPVGDEPSLLSFKHVKDLFTVFGYGLRSAFTTANYTASSRSSGIEFDCTDVPGSFMEKFCQHRETMKLISGHVDSGDQLPDELFDKVLAADQFMDATNFLWQLFVSATDLALHHVYDPFTTTEESIFDLQAELAPRFRVIDQIEGDRTMCRIGQIFARGYGAGYFSYTWSEMLSSDAFAVFEDQNKWETSGRHFRDTMLALVGIYDPTKVFEMFRGRKPNASALLKQRGIE
ncbi:Aste57867_18371 [Aphanomyces stellatus]|uniref:oligopeptidase A n=1 Tax=Aphanomyces stellatus TaxID=120398 RepID=A0A485LA61_9STRA|nr:hypothetical protein As57867_018309 [Aphanomyces stellatus]VFT95107.1 Aste57867_18371 [Aphanomyces stellatus]